jgi:hypothetical protein
MGPGISLNGFDRWCNIAAAGWAKRP